MFKAAREICTMRYEVNKCRKHMLLNDILQLVVLLDNYTTYVCMYVCMFACIYVCLCVYLCVCVCVYYLRRYG